MVNMRSHSSNEAKPGRGTMRNASLSSTASENMACHFTSFKNCLSISPSVQVRLVPVEWESFHELEIPTKVSTFKCVIF